MKPSVTTPTSQIYVRIAIVLAVVLSIGFTWLVLIAGALQPNIVNMLTQGLVVAVVVALLVLVIRRFRNTRANLMVARKNAEDEAALLRDRSAFMYAASERLSKKLAVFESNLNGLDPNDKNAGPLLAKTAELRHMLDRLETISHLEASMALTSKSQADAQVVIDGVANDYQARFTQKAATLQVSGSGITDVMMDPSTLKEVFASIVDNAYKFMPESGGLLDIVYTGSHGRFTIRFTDNGSGIDPAKLPELFKPFSRTDGVMAFNRQGEGLSLYLDKLCVEIAGGTITLDSKPDAGTTVTIELPTI